MCGAAKHACVGDLSRHAQCVALMVLCAYAMLIAGASMDLPDNGTAS